MTEKRGGNTNKGPKHNRFRHGMTATPTYKSWSGMKRRCYAPQCPDYKNYGGRGIVVCDRWMEFANFLEDMGVRPIGTTLERINNDGNYEPGNCRWATRTTQSRNRRYAKLSPRVAAQIRQDRESGKTLEWLSEQYGISQSHALRVVNREAWA